MSNRMVDGVLCLTLFITDHLFVHPDTRRMCPAAETDGGAAGGGVRRQAESVAWEKRARVQTAQRPGPGTSMTLPSGPCQCSKVAPLLLIGKKLLLRPESRYGVLKEDIKVFCHLQVCHRDVETEKRLKRDLKRTKVLLADAQIMLDHLKSNAPSKREIAQLKNQVRRSVVTI